MKSESKGGVKSPAKKGGVKRRNNSRPKSNTKSPSNYARGAVTQQPVKSSNSGVKGGRTGTKSSKTFNPRPVVQQQQQQEEQPIVKSEVKGEQKSMIVNTKTSHPTKGGTATAYQSFVMGPAAVARNSGTKGGSKTTQQESGYRFVTNNAGSTKSAPRKSPVQQRPIKQQPIEQQPIKTLPPLQQQQENIPPPVQQAVKGRSAPVQRPIQQEQQQSYGTKGQSNSGYNKGGFQGIKGDSNSGYDQRPIPQAPVKGRPAQTPAQTPVYQQPQQQQSYGGTKQQQMTPEQISYARREPVKGNLICFYSCKLI